MSNNISSFSDIKIKAKEKINNNRIYKAAFVAPSDIKTLQAVIKAKELGLVEPIFIGDELLITQKTEEDNIDINGIEILDLKEPQMALETALKLADSGQIDFIIKGKYDSQVFLQKLLSKDLGFAPKNLVSHVAVYKVSSYPKLLFLTDGFVNTELDLKKKTLIVNNVVNYCNSIGIVNPKTAILSAVEVVYPQMKATTAGAVLSIMNSRKQIKHCQIDGPLSLDIALDSHAAEAKGMTNSQVAGNADVLIAPDIETANGIYKAMSTFAKAEIGGILLGGKVPVTLNADCDSVESRFNSILLAILAI